MRLAPVSPGSPDWRTDQRQLLFPFVLPHERILPERGWLPHFKSYRVDLEYTAIPFAEQVCYTSSTHPEDKALLESNLSAEVGEQTDGQGTTLPFLF